MVASAVVALFVAGGLAAALGLRTVGGGSDAGPASSDGPYRGSEPPAGIRLPAFALRDYTGDVLRSDDLRGKVVLITFLDSQCTESCPIIASQIGRTVEVLGTPERRRVEAVAISTDPAEDTPRSVRAFLRKQHALGKLRYLTRPEGAIRSIWKQFDILSSLESGQDEVHSAPVRVYDGAGVWVSTLHPGVDLTSANLAHDIRLALERG